MDGLTDRLLEDLHRGNHLVSGERSHDDRGVALVQDRCGQPDGGRRVLGLVLQHEVFLLDLRQLCQDGGAVELAGDDHHPVLA